MSLTLRTVKGAPLTNVEVDGNFTYLDQKIDSEALILDQKIDNEVAGVRTIALNAEASANAAQVAAETAQDSAQAAQAGAQAAQTAAEAARDDAVAVVYSGDASLTPAAGKIPVARAGGEIDAAWVGATELPAIKPSLLLDFANSKVVDPRVTYACASPMPYYDGRTVVKAEENLLRWSQAFGDAAWSKTNATITENSTTAPDGTLTADKLVVSNAVNSGRVFQSLTLGASSAAQSVFAKAGEWDYVIVSEADPAAGKAVWFNLATGAVGTEGVNTTGTISDEGDGWYRCNAFFTASGSSATYRITASNADGVQSTGDGTSGIFIWGAQLEQRSFATAYTPTTTQPITRYQPKLLEAPANTPTITHDPVTGETLGLQVYGQATNLLTYSSDYSNAVWTTNATIASTTEFAPDGTNTAFQLNDTSAAAFQSASRQVVQTITANAAYTASAFFKKTSGAITNYPALGVALTGASTKVAYAILNTTAGTALFDSSSNIATQSITVVDCGGYWRLKVSFQDSASNTQCRVVLYPAASSNGTSISVAATGLATIWGAQLETGSVATPYIKTEGSQVTRAAVTLTPFATSGALGQGTLYAEYAGSSAIASIGTAAIGAPANRNRRKTAVAYDATSTVTVTDGGTPATTQGSLGASALTIGAVNGTVKKIAVYPVKSTNTQLQALTGA